MDNSQATALLFDSDVEYFFHGQGTNHYTKEGGVQKRKPEPGNRKGKQGITARSLVASLLGMTERAVFWAKDRGGKPPRYVGGNETRRVGPPAARCFLCGAW